MKTKSNQPLMFVCPECGRDFPSKYARKSHVCRQVAQPTSRAAALKAQRASRGIA